MPIVSTLAGVSMSMLWKEKSGTDEDLISRNHLCCCRCRCPCGGNNVNDSVQKLRGQTVMDTQPEDVKDFTVHRHNKGEEESPSSSSLSSAIVLRTPFCSLNGKAYAVPISMTTEFNALIERVQGCTYPKDWNISVRSSLASPGVLWRHDPYSMKVFDSSLFSYSVAGIEPDSKVDQSSPYKGNEESTEAVVESVGCPYSIYDTSMQDPILSFQPTTCPYGTGLYATAAESCYYGTYTDYQQMCGDMPLPQQFQQMYPYTIPPTAAEDVISGGCEQMHNWKDSSASVMPSSRPLPSSSGTRLVILPLAPPPPPPPPSHSAAAKIRAPASTKLQSPPAAEAEEEATSALPLTDTADTVAAVTSTVDSREGNNNSNHNSSDNTDVVMMTETEEPDCTGESERFSFRSRSHCNCHRPRAKDYHTDKGDDQCPSESPATLLLFHHLTLLFVDLAAHTYRRPHTSKNTYPQPQPQPRGLPQKNENNASAFATRNQFVYLVAHRCRRSVAAAAVRYDVDALVVLEGDMGIEMGTVQALLPLDEFDRLDPQELSNRGFPDDGDVSSAATILRGARSAERVHYMDIIPRLENDLLDFLRKRLDPTIFLDCNVRQMEFLGCEFQADCKKIYVYYKSKKRVLFRELARYLHSFYRCRIWFHEVGRRKVTASMDSSRATDI